MIKSGEGLVYPTFNSNGYVIHNRGLTKRELFAISAMKGYLSMLAWSDGEGRRCPTFGRRGCKRVSSLCRCIIRRTC